MTFIRGDRDGSGYENKRIDQFFWWRWQLRVVHIMYTHPNGSPGPTSGGTVINDIYQEVRGDSNGSNYENKRIDQFVSWRWQLRVEHIMHMPKCPPSPTLRGTVPYDIPGGNRWIMRGQMLSRGIHKICLMTMTSPSGAHHVQTPLKCKTFPRPCVQTWHSGW